MLASTSSMYLEKAGRGRGSLVMRSHAASPSSSGKMVGNNETRFALSSAERELIAAPISSTLLMRLAYPMLFHLRGFLAAKRSFHRAPYRYARGHEQDAVSENCRSRDYWRHRLRGRFGPGLPRYSASSADTCVDRSAKGDSPHQRRDARGPRYAWTSFIESSGG